MNDTPQNLPRKTAKSIVALSLTFAAGVVDIMSFILIYHVFVAHMTGSTVHLGHDLATGDWPPALRALTDVASFVMGSIAGRTMIEFFVRAHKRTAATSALLAEAALVLAFVWTSRSVLHTFPSDSIPLGTACWMLALLAAAMGLQTATLTRIGPLTIHTTFVTGMLNKLAQVLSQWMFWVYDEWRARTRWAHIVRQSRQHPALRNAQFMAGIWVCYAIGSVTGTWLNSRWSAHALYLPVAILLVAATVDQFRPLSVEEEHDQE